MVSTYELMRALRHARAVHTSIHMDAHLARVIIEGVYKHRAVAGTPFVEAMRVALNEAHIHDRATRRAYASLIGFFFGPHGARKRHKVKRAQKTHVSHVVVEVEQSGQYRWRM